MQMVVPPSVRWHPHPSPQVLPGQHSPLTHFFLPQRVSFFVHFFFFAQRVPSRSPGSPMQRRCH